MSKRMPDITVQTSRDTMGFGMRITAHIDSHHLEEAFGQEVICQTIEKVSNHLAAEFVEKHGIEIASKLDAQAIANLTIADAAAKTRELLDKKLPDRVEHHVREVTRVYQRGVFGGLKRLT